MTTPNRAAQTVQGPIDRVPCPWCGKSNDFREVDDLLSDDYATNLSFNCDHCSQPMRIAGIKTVKVILLRQGDH